MQVGTTKDQGLYNEPSAAGTLPQYNSVRNFKEKVIISRNSKGKHSIIMPKKQKSLKKQPATIMTMRTIKIKEMTLQNIKCLLVYKK